MVLMLTLIILRLCENNNNNLGGDCVWWIVCILETICSSSRPVGSDKYLVFNQHQQSSQRAHAHKLLDCSHIRQQHSTARISSELSARRR